MSMLVSNYSLSKNRAFRVCLMSLCRSNGGSDFSFLIVNWIMLRKIRKSVRVSLSCCVEKS